jgi:hypothetical protein
MENLTPMGAIIHQPESEALEVARYVKDFTGQLEALAVSGRLELLAHFLSMAKAEADLLCQADGAGVADEHVGPVNTETQNDNPWSEASLFRAK